MKSNLIKRITRSSAAGRVHLVGILRVSAHVAVAASSAIIVMASLSGWIGRIVFHSVAFNVSAKFLIILLCVFLGAQIGPRLSLNVNKVGFKKICGIFIVLIVILYTKAF